jgi:periplasmic protein TonB
MLHQLIESGTRRRRHTGWTLASTGVHAVLIAGAITLSLEEATKRIDIPAPPLIYVVPPQPPLEPVQPQRATAAVETGIQAPTRIPIELPPIPQVGPLLEQQLQVGGEPVVVSGGIGIGVTPDTVDGRIHTPQTVERAVLPYRGNGQPAYPATLRSAAIEGEVLVQFVVDTSGRVASGSIEILRTTHLLFAESARRWLTGTRYRPAQIGARPVRQLVQQQIGFALR